jgi:hypothetical protein
LRVLDTNLVKNTFFTTKIVFFATIRCKKIDNMEDSLVFNRTSLERGLFRSMSLKKYSSSITKNQDTSGDDKFMKPPPDKTDRIKNGQYEKMNEKGIVPEETRITNGDAILGKVTPINTTTNNGKIFKDSSEQYKSHADGVIDRVHVGIKNQDGYETRKVLVRSERFPYIGDKFCFRTDLGVEVYTNNGWKLLKDITVDDSVAILTDDDKYVFENPVGVYSFEYEGNIVSIRSDNVDIDVTIDHELYVKVDNNPHFTLERSDALLKSKVYFKHNASDEKGVKLFDDEKIPDFSRVNMKNKSKLYNYQGTVSCIEVRTHVFMARYNGKPFWIGNCSRHGQTFVPITGGNGFARIHRVKSLKDESNILLCYRLVDMIIVLLILIEKVISCGKGKTFSTKDLILDCSNSKSSGKVDENGQSSFRSFHDEWIRPSVYLNFISNRSLSTGSSIGLQCENIVSSMYSQAIMSYSFMRNRK